MSVKPAMKEMTFTDGKTFSINTNKVIMAIQSIFIIAVHLWVLFINTGKVAKTEPFAWEYRTVFTA